MHSDTKCGNMLQNMQKDEIVCVNHHMTLMKSFCGSTDYYISGYTSCLYFACDEQYEIKIK